MRNIGHPNVDPPTTPAERLQLARLKAKLLAATAARMGPIPGFEWDIDLSGNTTAHPIFGLQSTGLVTGAPVGLGTTLTPHTLRVEWDLPPIKGRLVGTFAVSAASGQIVGTVRATTSISGATLVKTGTAKVTGGTGAYRGFTSRGMPALKFTMASTAGSADSTVRIAGRVTSAAVNGKLVLRRLDPVTGQ